MKTFNMGKYDAYLWKGINKWGKKIKGIILAENESSAENEARKLNIPTIYYFKKKPYWMLSGEANKKTKLIDIVFVMRQLSTLISAGIPLVQSLEIMANGTEKVRMRALLLSIRDEVATGKKFSDTLKPYPYYFSQLICGLIAAGEESGTLDKMVSEIASYMEYQEFLKNRIKRALYYPMTITGVAILICLAMLIFLVPRFEKMYASFNAKLPGFTLIIIHFSYFIQSNWLTLLIVIAACIFGFKKLKEKSEIVQYKLDELKLHFLGFGSLVQRAIISRICSTLSITLTAGIPLIDALNRVSKITNNKLYEDAILQAREQVMQGESLSHSMRTSQLFPPMTTQMIEIGEKSGSLDQMFGKIGSYYRDQVNTSVEGLTTLIEPLMIVFIGLIVGIFILAMYLPIFNLGMAIK